MATPNYGYEKRQKELAKKRKNEEKLKLKADRKKGLIPAEDMPPENVMLQPETSTDPVSALPPDSLET